MPDAARLRVLVVDDEADLRETLQDWLEADGCLVTAAADGAAALAALRAAPPDVVVADLRMAGMDGLALLDAIRAEDAALPVVFLSGQASKGDVIAALREGRAFDFLEKPLPDLGLLSRAIRRAVAARPAPAAGPPPGVPPLPDPAAFAEPVRAVMAAVRTRFREPLTLAGLAEATSYNAAYLSALIGRETGQPLSRWLMAARLAEACRLLAETDLPIPQVATAAGFGDADHFGRAFRQALGTSPSGWRRARGGA